MSKYSPLQKLAVFERVKVVKIIFKKSQKFTIFHYVMYKNSPLLHDVFENGQKRHEFVHFFLYKYSPLLHFLFQLIALVGSR